MRSAYARLARDRAGNRTLVGELILIVAGAAAGAAITTVLRSTAGVWALGLALLVGMIGVLLRTFAAQRWIEIAEEYER
jgi:Flp pilus assembly protein TadB